MKEYISNVINFIIIYVIAKIIFTLWGFWVIFKTVTSTDLTFPGNKEYPLPIWVVFGFFFIVGFIFFITSYIFLYIMFLLFFIFIAWLVIKYIVPIVYIFFIPFPPFFAPIPLRYVILEKVPPFKDLTDAGILPLMERILFTLISGEVIKNKIKHCFEYIFDFLKMNIKVIIKKKFPNINLDTYFIEKKEEEKVEEKEEEEKVEENKNQYYQKALKIISAEYENCYNKNKKILDNLSEAEVVVANIQNEGVKLKCYSESISSYIRANY